MLVFNIIRIFAKLNLLGYKVGTYAAALFLLKDTFKESVDPKMFEREFLKFIKENDIKLADTITEEGELVDGKIRQSLVIFEGNWFQFFTRPIAVTFFILSFILVRLGIESCFSASSEHNPL